MKDIKYPAIITDETFEFIEIINKPITIANKMTLKNDNFHKMLVIDSDGNSFDVLSMTKINRLHPMWRFEFFNPMFEVKIELRFNQKIDFEKLKLNITKSIKKNRDYWDADGNFESRLTNIKSSSSYKSLVNYLS